MKTWLIGVLSISFILLALLKAHEVSSLSPYFNPEKALRLKYFTEAKSRIDKSDLNLLELWESILTGRSAPLSKIMKENYKALGLNHIFTPSGFHLSAVIFPFMKILKSNKFQFIFLLLIGGSLPFLPGFGALKRMVLIKINQKIMGLHIGFVFALIIDIFFGTFQNSPISFTYSFLFIGIIYSGFRGLGLIVWFFVGQMVLAYFQGNDISILLLIFSPLLNFIFAFIMPLLFVLAFPLWDWQLSIGLFLLQIVQDLVDVCASISFLFPTLEVNIVIFIMIGLLVLRKFRFLICLIIIFSSSLNTDTSKASFAAKYEFRPQGRIVKTIYQEKDVKVFFSDGKCKMKLIRGFWYENCSPKRRSSRGKKIS